MPMKQTPAKPLLCIMLALWCCASLAPAAIKTVGVGKMYANPSQAATAAANGDIIEIDAGLYVSNAATWTASNLIIRGVGDGRAHLEAGGVSAGGKAIWVITGTNTIVQNIEFSGASVADTNGAGIRQEGSGLIVSNCYFHDNENGILTAPTAGEIVIENSEFANNGYGDGLTHNMYIGNINKFTLRYCYTHHAKVGHTIKSRAKENYILYNRIMDEVNGTSSLSVDIPNGGLSFIIGNLIQQGNLSPNNGIISYAEEGGSNPTQKLYVVNNTIVNERLASALFIKVVGSAPATAALIMNNIFVGTGTLTNGVNTFTNNLILNGTQLVNCAAYDYHLIPGSQAIDQGVDPGSVNGVSLMPVFHYVHPATGEVRPVVSLLDVGAYECTDTDGNGMPDNWERQFFGSLTNAKGAASADWDGDGANNLQEYQADTDPASSNSYLRIVGIQFLTNGIRVNLLGGSNSWQYLECSQNLGVTGSWTALLTNVPPTQPSTNFFDVRGTNVSRFYRVTVERK